MQSLNDVVAHSAIQSKGAFPLKKKFQKRLFVLTADALNYFEGTDLVRHHAVLMLSWTLIVGQRKVKFKGQIFLTSVRAVEVIESKAFGRPAMFQIVHDGAILYLQADTQAERADWLDALRSGTSACALHATNVKPRVACELPENVSSKHEQYHPGIYKSSEWTCCGLRNKPSGGCKVVAAESFRFLTSSPIGKPSVLQRRRYSKGSTNLAFT